MAYTFPGPHFSGEDLELGGPALEPTIPMYPAGVRSLRRIFVLQSYLKSDLVVAHTRHLGRESVLCCVVLCCVVLCCVVLCSVLFCCVVLCRPEGEWRKERK